ncbi:MAG: hypothetical protein RR540_07315 [Oscillospiraceae bacterium]
MGENHRKRLMSPEFLPMTSFLALILGLKYFTGFIALMFLHTTAQSNTERFLKS